jgi:hypothetical protein
VRRNVGADTPFPPEVPHALNPREGAQVDYWLAREPASDISLDVFDAKGERVRHMSSAEVRQVTEYARPPHPNFWVLTETPLSKTAGAHRTNWDLRYDAPRSFTHSYEINANPGLTPPSPEGPLVAPGTYSLKLTVDGQSYTQAVVVRADPRSPATPAAIVAQTALQVKLTQAINFTYDAQHIAAALGEAVRGDTASLLYPFYARLDSVAGLDAQRRQGRGPGPAPAPTLRALNGSFVNMLNAQDNGDLAPTPALLSTFASRCRELQSVATRWERLLNDLVEVNRLLQARGNPKVSRPTNRGVPPTC